MLDDSVMLKEELLLDKGKTEKEIYRRYYSELSTDEWLHKIGFDGVEYECELAKINQDEVLRELKREEWRLWSADRYKNRLLFCGTDETYLDSKGRIVFGFDNHEDDILDPTDIGIDPMMHYIEKERVERIKELAKQILNICTPKEKMLLSKLAIFERQYCDKKCKKITECTIPDFSKECKRHLKGNEFISYKKVADMLHITKAAVSQKLSRLGIKAMKKLRITQAEVIELGFIKQKEIRKNTGLKGKKLYRNIPELEEYQKLKIGIDIKAFKHKYGCSKYNDLCESFHDEKTKCSWCNNQWSGSKCSVKNNMFKAC